MYSWCFTAYFPFHLTVPSISKSTDWRGRKKTCTSSAPSNPNLQGYVLNSEMHKPGLLEERFRRQGSCFCLVLSIGSSLVYTAALLVFTVRWSESHKAPFTQSPRTHTSDSANGAVALTMMVRFQTNATHCAIWVISAFWVSKEKSNNVHMG